MGAVIKYHKVIPEDNPKNVRNFFNLIFFLTKVFFDKGDPWPCSSKGGRFSVAGKSSNMVFL